MIQVDSVSKRYGRLSALQDVSFSVPSGQVVGLLGQNGAGKTTLLNILSGYIPPTEGSVMVRDISLIDDPIGAKSFVGYLPEHAPLYPEMTITEFLHFCCDLKGVVRSEQRGHVAQVMQLTGLKDHAHRPIGKLSKGYQQRTGLAQALCGTPAVLLLDEPTAGFDPSQAAEFRELIRSLSKKHTIILSSHILSEIQAMCDRVLILHQGKLLYDQVQDEKKQKPIRTMRLRAVADKDKLMATLRSINGVRRIKRMPDPQRGIEVLIECEQDTRFEEQLSVLLCGLGAIILQLSPVEDGLEDVFLKLTSSPLHGGTKA